MVGREAKGRTTIEGDIDCRRTEQSARSQSRSSAVPYLPVVARQDASVKILRSNIMGYSITTVTTFYYTLQ